MSTAKRKDLGKMFETAPPDKAVKITEKRPDREGKRAKLFHLSEAANKQLAYLSIEVERTQQDLLVEGLNYVFKKYGKPPIA